MVWVVAIAALGGDAAGKGGAGSRIELRSTCRDGQESKQGKCNEEPERG